MMNAPFPLAASPMSWPRLLLVIFVLSFALSSLLSLILVNEASWASEHGDTAGLLPARHHPINVAYSLFPTQPPKPASGSASTSNQRAASSTRDTATASAGASHQASSSSSSGGDEEIPDTSARVPTHSSFVDSDDLDEMDSVDSDTDARSADPHSALGVSLASLLFAPLAADEAVIDEMERDIQRAIDATHELEHEHTNLAAASESQPKSAGNEEWRPMTLAALSARSHHLHLAHHSDDDLFSALVVEPSPTQSIVQRVSRSSKLFFEVPPKVPRRIVPGDWLVDWQHLFDGYATASAVSGDHRWTAVAVNTERQGSEGLEFAVSIAVIHWDDAITRVHTIPLHGQRSVIAMAISSTTSCTDSACVRLSYSREFDQRVFRSFLLTFNPGAEQNVSIATRKAEDGPVRASANDRPWTARLLPLRVAGTPSKPVLNRSADHVIVQLEDSAHQALVYTRHYSNDHEQRNRTSATAHDSDSAGEGGLASAAVRPPLHWQLATSLPNYRTTGTASATAHQPLIATTTANHRFVCFARVPFVSVLDAVQEFTPIEIIHLAPDTVFIGMAISEDGELLALLDQRGDTIILHRHLQVEDTPTDRANLNDSLSRAWSVELELTMPQNLKRIEILAIHIVAVQRQRVTESANTAHHTSLLSHYLVAMFEGGVIASFDLSLATRKHSGPLGHATNPFSPSTSTFAILLEILYLNPEMLVGFAVVLGSAIVSIAFTRTNAAIAQNRNT